MFFIFPMSTFSWGLILFRKNHIDLFWHLQPSSERIKSIQGRFSADAHSCTHTHISTHGYCIFGSVHFTSLRISPKLVLKNYLTLTRVLQCEPYSCIILLWTAHTRRWSPKFQTEGEKNSLSLSISLSPTTWFSFCPFCMFLPYHLII